MYLVLLLFAVVHMRGVASLEAVSCASELDFGKLIAFDDRRKWSEAFFQTIPVMVVQPSLNGR